MKRIALALCLLPSMAFAQAALPTEITVKMTIPEAQMVFGMLKAQADPVNALMKKIADAANPPAQPVEPKKDNAP